MADWSELKRLAEEAQSTFGSFDPSEAEFDLMAAITPDVILALIAENEEMVRRIRFFKLVHGGRASEVFHQMSVLHDEVRRLNILAGEGVPPLPEEFIGPLPENCYARLRRKLRDLNAAPKVPESLVFPPIEQQTAAGDAGATENHMYNEKLQDLQAEREALASLLRRFVENEHNPSEDQNERHWYHGEAETLLAKISGKHRDYALVPEESLQKMVCERDQLRAEVEALRGSCKELGRENTLLTRRAKKAERAVLWFASIRVGFLRPKWLMAVIDSLKGGRDDG